MTSELTTRADQPAQTIQATLNDQMRYAQAIAQAGILPQAYKGHPADVLVAIGLGQSMGLTPAQSLYRINVIQGKPTASGELIASAVRRAGHKLRKIHEDPQAQSVTVEIVRADDPDYPFRVTRDRAWATQMGLAGKDNYKRQPMTMLYWRAVTACAREACPEALYGIAYTPDEMRDAAPAAADPDVHVQVEADPTPTEGTSAAAQSGEPMATPEQAQQINDLIRQGGVDSSLKAFAAFHALCGRDINTAAQLTRSDAEALLSAPQLVITRTQTALKELEKDDK